jgi:uncharacterized membrane protein
MISNKQKVKVVFALLSIVFSLLLIAVGDKDGWTTLELIFASLSIASLFMMVKE